MNKRIIWTRPAEDWEHDAKLLRLEKPLFRFPLTRQVAIKPQMPPKPCDLVILTSRKAADAFLHRMGLSKEHMHRIEFLTFGMETYKYLLSQNLKTRLIQAPGGKEFAAALVLELKRDQVIWFPRPLETAYPISEHLRTHHFEIYDLELYKTETVKHLEPPALQSLFAEPSIVCFASPLAIKAFVDLIRQYDEARFYKYTAVAIGATTKASGQSYFNEVHLAQHPTLASLFEKAQEISRAPHGDS